MNLSFLLENPDDLSLTALKMVKLKKSVIKRLVLKGEGTIAELCKETDFSIPTVTKIISELIDEGIVFEKGKIDTAGGRRPFLYGINPEAGYYLGVEVKRDSVSIGLQNFRNEFVKEKENISFLLENTKESLNSLCTIIQAFIEETKIPLTKFIGACITLSGRINSKKGFSYSYFFFEETPLNEVIEGKIGIKTFVENDTRAMVYGEYNGGVVDKEKDVIFVNIGLGVGIGIICNGKLFYGKSGFSGEFGHSPIFDNEILCHCGKKGCLETEISGIALERKFRKSVESGSNSILAGSKPVAEITVFDILTAIQKNEDTLAIEIIEEIGGKLGRYLSMLINIFNPELVILGGLLAETGMYLRLPVRTTLQKYSLSLVSHDMELKMSALGSKAGIVGACFILRDKLFYHE